jgi:hypothetical protein
MGLSVGILIKVLSCMNFKRIIIFTLFCAVNADFRKGILIIGFSKAALLKTVVYYKQDFFRQNQFAPCAGTRVTTLKILTILTVKYFWWATRPPVPHF